MRLPENPNNNSTHSDSNPEPPSNSRFVGNDHNIPILRVETEIYEEENEENERPNFTQPSPPPDRDFQNLQNDQNLRNLLLEEANRNQVQPNPEEANNQNLADNAQGQFGNPIFQAMIRQRMALRNQQNDNPQPVMASPPPKPPIQMSYIFETNSEPEKIEIGEFGVVDSLFQISTISTLNELIISVFLLVSVFVPAPFWALFSALSAFSLLRLFYIIFHLHKNRRVDKALLFNFYILILDTSMLALFLASIAAFLLGIVGIWLVLGINLLLLFNSVWMYFLSKGPRVYEGEGIYQIIMNIGSLMIFLKLGGFVSISWYSAVLVFRIELWLFKVLGGFMAFLLPIIIGLGTIIHQHSFEAGFLKIFRWILSMFLLFVFCINRLYRLYFQLLQTGVFVPQSHLYAPFDAHSQNPVWQMSVMLFLLFVLEVFFFAECKNMFKFLIAQECLVTELNKTIEITKFSQPLDLQLIRMGTNFFKRNLEASRTQKAEIGKSLITGMAECLICCDRPSNVLIRPCNHGGLCDFCAQKLLVKNSNCPHCKVPISKFYVFRYEKGTGKYFAHRMMQIDDQQR